METEPVSNLAETDANAKEEGKKISPEDIGQQIRSSQVGDRFLAVGMLIVEPNSGKIGELVSLKKVHDPIFHFKKPTLSMVDLHFIDGTNQEMRASDTIPLYRKIPTAQEKIKENLSEPEIPQEFENKFSLNWVGTYFRLNEQVWIAGQIGTIVMINPGENPQIVVTAKNRKGYKRLFSVSPSQIQRVKYNSDGSMKKQ